MLHLHEEVLMSTNGLHKESFLHFKFDLEREVSFEQMKLITESK